jgi:hypothetical protein
MDCQMVNWLNDRPTIFCLGFVSSGYVALLAIEQTGAVQQVLQVLSMPCIACNH